MASTASSMKSVLRAHAHPVNGVIALPPSIDDATITLENAHAVLILARTANEEKILNPDIIEAGFRAAETLLEGGIRDLVEGHRRLASLVRAH